MGVDFSLAPLTAPRSRPANASESRSRTASRAQSSTQDCDPRTHSGRLKRLAKKSPIANSHSVVSMGLSEMSSRYDQK